MPREEFEKTIKVAKKHFLLQLENTQENPSTNVGNHGSDQISSTFQKNVHIYCNLSIDGLCAATILSKTLEFLKIGHQISMISKLETENLLRITSQARKTNQYLIFCGIGANKNEEMNKNIESKNFIIIDHHLLARKEKLNPPNLINPFYFEIDGTSEITTSGISYLLSKALVNQNLELHYLALIGALAEQQNVGPKGKFLSFNQDFLNEAEGDGKVKTDLNIAISRIKPLDIALANTFPENLPPISNNIKETQKFLQNIKVKATNEINSPRTLEDLSTREKTALMKGLIQLSVNSKTVKKDFAKRLIRTFYRFTEFHEHESLSEGFELIQVLQECIKKERVDLGIALLMGDKKAQETVIEQLKI